MNRIIRFLFGYVLLAARGAQCPRLLTLAAKRHIGLWDLRRDGEILYIGVRRSSYAPLQTLAAGCGVKLTLLQEKGLPLYLNRLWQRKGLLCGTVLAAVLYLLLFSKYWGVGVTGNSVYSAQQVLAAARQAGLYEGADKGQVSTRGVGNRIMLLLPRISWISVNTNGCYAVIDLREAEPKPSIVSDRGMSDIVADYDGQILCVEAFFGTAMVKPGDVVTAGQVLISGELRSPVPGSWDGETYVTGHVRATGKVTARTLHVFTAQVPLNPTLCESTGSTVQRKSFYCLGAYVPLSAGAVPKGTYALCTADSPFTLFGRVLPMGIYTETFVQKQYVTRQLTGQQARVQAQAALAALQQSVLGEDGKVVEQTLEFTFTQTDCIVACRAACDEEIGVSTETSLE